MNGFVFRELSQTLAILQQAKKLAVSVRVEDNDGMPLDGVIAEVSPTSLKLLLTPVVANLQPSLHHVHKMRWTLNQISFITSVQLLEADASDHLPRKYTFGFPLTLCSKDAREYARFVLPPSVQLVGRITLSENQSLEAKILDVSPCGFRCSIDQNAALAIVAGTAIVFDIPSAESFKPMAAIAMWTRSDSVGFFFPELRGVDTSNSDHPWLQFINNQMVNVTLAL